ncbi:hypothetical protein BB561_006508 [Smittium simulii]|uniref:Peptidase S1 domain-containing protein n=1 Tax=Smittium simulii TaxID=133385 RepID=A0A2T9Y3H2_9FUNG|nr:hypothetical protein BB561_006508 [Smittium simulii]
MRFTGRFLFCVSSTILIQSSLFYFVEPLSKVPFVKSRSTAEYLAGRGINEGTYKKCTGILVSPNVVITTENCASGKLVRINPDLAVKHRNFDRNIAVHIETTNRNAKNLNYVVDKSILITEFNTEKNSEITTTSPSKSVDSTSESTTSPTDYPEYPETSEYPDYPEYPESPDTTTTLTIKTCRKKTKSMSSLTTTTSTPKSVDPTIPGVIPCAAAGIPYYSSKRTRLEYSTVAKTGLIDPVPKNDYYFNFPPKNSQKNQKNEKYQKNKKYQKNAKNQKIKKKLAISLFSKLLFF